MTGGVSDLSRGAGVRIVWRDGVVWARLGDALFGLLGFLVWYRKSCWVICCGHHLGGCP